MTLIDAFLSGLCLIILDTDFLLVFKILCNIFLVGFLTVFLTGFLIDFSVLGLFFKGFLTAILFEFNLNLSFLSHQLDFLIPS